MNLKTIMENDLQAIAGDFDNPTITWQGEDYECVPASAGELSSLGVGGFGADVDIILAVRQELFTDGILPKSQEIITYSSRTYRIHRVRKDPFSAFIKLDCVDHKRGV